MSLRLLLAATLALLTTVPVYANADAEKLAFIRDNFQDVRDHSFYWQNGWATVMAANTIGRGILASQTGSRNERYDSEVSAITSALGFASLMMDPMRSHQYADEFKQRDVSLTEAEQWLKKAAARERYEQGWLNRLSSFVVNGVAGLYVAYDHKRPSDGWLMFATGMIATEARILTAPTHMSDTWEAYQRGDLSPLTAANSNQPGWHIAAFGPLVSVQYQF